MGMVAFFPWLMVREPVQVGSFRLFPYSPNEPLPDGVTGSVAPEILKRLLTQYRVHAQHEERARCLLQCGEKPVGDDLDPGKRSSVFRFARHLAVSGLATRRFDGSPIGSYSASGHYQVIVQQFPTPFAGSVLAQHRRKDGETRVLISAGAQNFQIPEHLVGQATPTLDLTLLSALEAAHQALSQKDWGPYEASITQFLMANSDSPDVPLDAESIATYAALERLVDADHKKADFLKRVLSCLAEVDTHELAGELRDGLMPGREPRDVVSGWLEGLYNLRGNAGHGFPVTKLRNATWVQFEHLLAGAFVYPLALKCRLKRAGHYTFTSQDVVDIVGLDLLLGDRPFYAATDGGIPQGGWPRQMEVLGRAWASCELSRYIGDAYDEVLARSGAEGGEPGSGQ